MEKAQGTEPIVLEVARADAARMLAAMHTNRTQHVQHFGRQDCWQDRVICALERAFGTVAGPPSFPERAWVCQCCTVNATGSFFCRGCDQPRLRDDGLSASREGLTG